jgi:hypothetical protein
MKLLLRAILFITQCTLLHAGSFTDVVPVTDLSGPSSTWNGLFALTPGQTHLLFSPLPSNPSPLQISQALAALRPVSGIEYLDDASRITYNNGYLFALVPTHRAIRYFNLRTKTTGAIDLSPASSAASLDFAASDSGFLAITNSTENSIRIISVAGANKFDKTFEGIFAKNVRSPAWVGDILYILRDNLEQCVGIDVQRLLSTTGNPIELVKSPISQVFRLYSWRSVLYFLTDEGLYTLPGQSNAISRI